MARILVVDDVRFISQMIAGVFERIGHRVETAADGEEALRKAGAMLPDLIVMDVAMPKLDGLEVTRRLREADRTRDIPILLVTSRSDGGTLTSAVQVGVDDHLAKPFEAPVLLAKSARLLGGYPMTFDLALLGEIAIVTALPDELSASAAEQIGPALEHARGAALAVILLDLTRVTRVDAPVGEAILAFEEAFRRDGGSLELVRPKAGLGIRGFLAQVSARLRVHDDPESARAALGLASDLSAQPIPPPRRAVPRTPGQAPVATSAPAGRPAATVTPSPDQRSAPAPPAPGTGHPVTRTGAARGVVLETHPQAMIARIHRPELDDEVLELLRTEAQRMPRAVLLEMTSVTALDPERARALGDIAARAQAAGASFRVVNPPPIIESALEDAGLSTLILHTRSRDDASTRASS